MLWPAELRPYERTSSLATVGGFRPPDDPSSSWIGDVRVGAHGETWPRSADRALHPVCQIRLADLPAAVPAPLAGFALLALFVDLGEPPGTSDEGNGWAFRTYGSVDDLVPLERPASFPDEDLLPRPFPLRWSTRVEVPSHDEAPPELHAIYEATEATDWPRAGLKVGGWPETIQSEVSWWKDPIGRVSDADLVLQVDTDEKSGFTISDLGVAYVGWSPTAGWLFEWQCF